MLLMRTEGRTKTLWVSHILLTLLGLCVVGVLPRSVVIETGDRLALGAPPRALYREDLRSVRAAVPWELAPGGSWSWH